MSILLAVASVGYVALSDLVIFAPGAIQLSAAPTETFHNWPASRNSELNVNIDCVQIRIELHLLSDSQPAQPNI